MPLIEDRSRPPRRRWPADAQPPRSRRYRPSAVPAGRGGVLLLVTGLISARSAVATSMLEGVLRRMVSRSARRRPDSRPSTSAGDVVDGHRRWQLTSIVPARPLGRAPGVAVACPVMNRFGRRRLRAVAGVPARAGPVRHPDRAGRRRLPHRR